MHLKRQKILCFWFTMAKNRVNLNKNYYKILQISTGCDQKTIKKSYLALVKKHHPDVNPNGKQKFTEVQEAYEVLSNGELKTYYDQNNDFRPGFKPKNSQNNSSYSSHYNTTQQNRNQNGHSYYTNRNYSSQNVHDYYRQKKTYQEWQKQKAYEEKKKKSQEAYRFYKQYEQKRKQQYYKKKKQTPEEIKMRQKLREMRGYVSSFNSFWQAADARQDKQICTSKKYGKDELDELHDYFTSKAQKYFQKIRESVKRSIPKNKD